MHMEFIIFIFYILNFAAVPLSRYFKVTFYVWNFLLDQMFYIPDYSNTPRKD